MGQEETTTPVDEHETVAENEQPQTIPEGSTHAETSTSTEEDSNLKVQAEEYLAGWQRTRAEFANYKKRVDREMSESRQKGALDALTKVLPIIDDFERAMENIPADLKDNPWTTGVSLLLKKLDKLLDEYNVTVIDPVGQVFDPSQHEAIGMDDSDTVESGHVTVTLQKGYASGDKVLRPALVRVAN